ncbi:MAG: isoleucine--tRNA ligase [Candidatus Paraimprobicoccus trichonymphae]|uniref:Isoleucine--tRNA ligase n=1 Tax=Candidatus Paraimprobicoccus trichonymphae TaxID=3033793 RepID=A0AA48I4H2_9FIRM|nr:MAG: isoleucine--tRNA ligase [Candidatus Paraimprobicoccus trichonymphae]
MPEKNYNSTINLPKTDFPMKANLPKNEVITFKNLEEKNIYSQIMRKNALKPLYILHDGPPYANGNIHLGHALNKILKDFVVKYKNMSGFRSPYVPGWDTHGLPTELKAREKAKIKKNQDISDLELRTICKEFAVYYMNKQREQFKKLGLLGDWDNPYITLLPEFESKQIEVFAKMASEKAIYQGLKPVHWCYTCETALAEAEIEYNQDNCRSIYVKFRVKTPNIFLKGLKVDVNNTYFVIWTTTTWTLPANVAICLHPKMDYNLIKSKNEYYIIAKDLVKNCMEGIANIGEYKIVSNLKGFELENITVFHPFLDRESVIITGEHVTADSGTGCVHTAPGHGIEDFEVCSRYKDIPVVVPVDSKGVLTEEVGEFKNIHISKVEENIIENLKKSNLLFGEKHLKHQYPHCWRCKQPVIFRATKQWFCSIDKFKNQALKSINSVNWIPKWGKDRISSMISDRKDWCISRQRKWGVPIPIFFCDNCKEPLINSEVMSNVSKIFKSEGSDSWYCKNSEYFITENIKCPKCKNDKFTKENDIMDVWFDSGVTHEVVCKREDMQFPADLYLEGSDQYRGWFQSSLLTSVCINDKAPYKNVVSHGWVVDEEGKKQSKSLGNGIKPTEVINKYGTDIFRLWVASSDYHSDVKISHNILNQLSESYRKIRNTFKFIIGNLYDFDPNTTSFKFEKLLDIDKFILNKLNKLYDILINSYQNFEFHYIFHSIQKFCIINLSNFYLDIIKDRLYVEKADSFKRKTAQYVIYIILSNLIRFLAPILAYTSEEVWNHMPHKTNENLESILLNDILVKSDFDLDSNFSNCWEKLQELKNEVRKTLEQARKDKVIGSSLEAKVLIFSKNKEILEFLSNNYQNLKDILIVSEIEISDDFDVLNKPPLEKMEDVFVSIEHSINKKCERCWMYLDTVGKNLSNFDLCERCIKVLE